MGIEKTVGKAALEIAQNENLVNKTTDFLGMLFLFVGLKKKALEMLTKYFQDGSTRILEDSEYEVFKSSEDHFRVLKTHIDVQVKEFSENTE